MTSRTAPASDAVRSGPLARVDSEAGLTLRHPLMRASGSKKHYPRLRSRSVFVAKRSLLRKAFALAIIAAASGHLVRAQPTGPTKIVFPFPAGTGPDVMVRTLSEQIVRTRALSMFVENRPGAASLVGTEEVARASPDGRTLLFTSNLLLVTPHLRRVDYDPIISFAPVCRLARSPLLIVVNGVSPYRTLSDLVGAARSKPGDLTLAGVGPASPTQLSFEMFVRAANVDMIFVPYPGMAPTTSALLGDHVTSAILDYSTAAEQLRTGGLRALATLSATRIEPLPDLPTVGEAGFRNVEMDLWFGSFAPARTPRETVNQIAGWLADAIRDPGVAQRLSTLGIYPEVVCGADFEAYLRKSYDEYGRIIREADIKPE
jgi:tripartite-type tricarboxylate transporter receptor subunit TctC